MHFILIVTYHNNVYQTLYQMLVLSDLSVLTRKLIFILRNDEVISRKLCINLIKNVLKPFNVLWFKKTDVPTIIKAHA